MKIRANPITNVLANSVLLVVAIIILGASVAFAGNIRLHIGIEIFTASPEIVTVEKEEAAKIDNSGASNTGIQDQLNAGNNKTETQNSDEIEKIMIKVPSSKASKALRETECAYLAVRLKQLLDDTGKYGMVHVIPASKVKGNRVVPSSTAFDYVIHTEILKSDGYRVAFRVRYLSSINGYKKPVRKFKIKDDIPESAYVGDKNTATGVVWGNDPYDSVLVNIVSIFNKMIKEEQIMYPLKRHQELTNTRYGHEVLPDGYNDYRITKESNEYVVDPAPDPANYSVNEVTMWKLDELEGIEKFEEHYKKAANDVEGPYNSWRRESRKALIAYKDLKDEIKKVHMDVTMIFVLETMTDCWPSPKRQTYSKGELLFLSEILLELKKSMIEKDGYITVPVHCAFIKNNAMEEIAYRLEKYNEQVAVQAVAVGSFKETFSTLSGLIVLDLGAKSKTYYGKIDEVFRQFKEDLSKYYYKKIL